MDNKLHLLVSISKSNKDIEIKYSELLTIRIPEEWQKRDKDINSQALWVANLSDNPLEIRFIKMYPSSLLIKRKGKTYQGNLLPTGTSEDKNLYSCEMIEVKNKNWALTLLFIFFIIVFLPKFIDSL